MRFRWPFVRRKHFDKVSADFHRAMQLTQRVTALLEAEHADHEITRGKHQAAQQAAQRLLKDVTFATDTASDSERAVICQIVLERGGDEAREFAANNLRYIKPVNPWIN